MKPYYEDDWVTLYHADARELQLPADVLITDPPYGAQLTTKTTGRRWNGKRSETFNTPASVVYDDSAEHVRTLISSVVLPQIALCDRALIFTGTTMLYDYPPPASIGCVFTPAGTGCSAWGFTGMHPVRFYGRDPYLVDQRGGRLNSFSAGAESNSVRWDHPCPKPMPWLRWAVNRASRPGETIIDPFAGTGTTLRAAKDLGRRSIGIEIEEHYCAQIVQRLAQEVLPLDQPELIQETFSVGA